MKRYPIAQIQLFRSRYGREEKAFYRVYDTKGRLTRFATISEWLRKIGARLPDSGSLLARFSLGRLLVYLMLVAYKRLDRWLVGKMLLVAHHALMDAITYRTGVAKKHWVAFVDANEDDIKKIVGASHTAKHLSVYIIESSVLVTTHPRYRVVAL